MSFKRAKIFIILFGSFISSILRKSYSTYSSKSSNLFFESLLYSSNVILYTLYNFDMYDDGLFLSLRRLLFFFLLFKLSASTLLNQEGLYSNFKNSHS